MTHTQLRSYRWTRPLLLALALGGVACGPAAQQGPRPTLVADPPPGDGTMPGAGLADFDRGVAMIEKEAYPEAIVHFDRALKAQPKNSEATYYRALAHDKLGKREEAMSGYEKAIELDAKLTTARVNLGAMLLEEPPQPERAVKVLEPAAEQEPKAADIRENLGYAYTLLGNVEKAAAAYDAAIAIQPSARLHLAYAELMFGAKRLPEAATQYNLALPGFKDDLKHTAYIAHRLAKSKDYKACVGAFGAAIELKKDEPAFFLHRGICHHQLDNEDSARADYKQATVLNPKFQPAFYYLGKSYLITKARGKAVQTLQRAVELNPKSPVGKKAREELEKLK